MKKSVKLIIIICAIVAACCAAYLVYHFISSGTEREKDRKIEDLVTQESASAATESSAAASDTSGTDESRSRPYVPSIDFSALKDLNEEAYAWLYMDNTDISYPVVQHADTEDRDFYLYRDLDGNYSESGTLYTVPPTAPGMTDPVTIIYGHNGSRFAELKNFRDEAYWDKHRTFSVSIDGAVFVYRVFAAKVYTDVMLPTYFDLDSEEGRAALLYELTSPVYINDRVDETVSVDTGSHIVILSTCLPDDLTRRYLIAGVLEDYFENS